MDEKQSKEIKVKLEKIVQQYMKKETMYKKEEIIAINLKVADGDRERAETGFRMMLEYGVIEQANEDGFYIAGSTPF